MRKLSASIKRISRKKGYLAWTYHGILMQNS
jgi:hypothetical protein